MSVFLLNSENEVDVDSPGGVQSQTVSEASQALVHFWPKATEEIRKIDQVKTMEVRAQALPLARIKKIMKLDEDVKMISAEAPVLFAKAAELFIEELTLRAWVHTEDNKRRTLQRNDIAMAITKYDQFDFLIDIVPRDEVKPAGVQRTTQGGGSGTQDAPRAAINADQVHYYFQLAQQHQAALSSQSQSQSQGQGGGQAVVAQAQPAHQEPSPPKPSTSGASNNGNSGGIQLVQQIVTPTGEVQHIPIQVSASQMAMLRMQLQNNSGQPIIIQSSPLQQQPQIIQVTQQNSGTPVYIQNSGGNAGAAVATESD